MRDGRRARSGGPGAPRYLALHATGELRRRAQSALAALSACELCPHRCRVDRTRGELGFCRTGALARVASAGPHYGEEAPLVGRGGSGTIFFAGCTMRCVFCQNADISQTDAGEKVSAEELAGVMLALERAGCENINLVSPTHVTPQILAALDVAVGQGLSIPLVWNTGGYERLETLALLDRIVDIYLPDAKYASEVVARRLSGVRDYPAHMRAALVEMHRQVGDLVLDERGVALRGLIVRHLVLPGGLAGTEEVVRFIAEVISSDTYVNVMGQYRPCYRAHALPPLDRRVTPDEVAEAIRAARNAGLTRLAG